MADWSNENILRFLEIYESEPVIWDPKHPQHKDKTLVNEAWNRIQTISGKPVWELKKKKESLMATFRLHFRKQKASITSGAGADEMYRPIWFAFQLMERFLRPVYECESTYGLGDNTDMASEVPSVHTPLSRTSRSDFAKRSSAVFVSGKRSFQKNNFKSKFSRTSELPNKANSEDDEFDVAGKMVAFHLRAMESHQRLMAEKLVSEIMFSGRMGNLSANSKFIESTLSQSSDTSLYLPSQSSKMESVILSNENEESISSIDIKRELLEDDVDVPSE